MTNELLSWPERNFPRWPSWLSEDGWWRLFSRNADVALSEDDAHVYVEAPVPGIDPSAIDVTFDNGTLVIHAKQEEKTEDKKRTYYRERSRSYSYRVDLPENVDRSKDPDIRCKSGMLTATFQKTETKPTKRLPIQQ